MESKVHTGNTALTRADHYLNDTVFKDGTQPHQAAHVYLPSPCMGVPGPSPLSMYLTSDKPDQTRTNAALTVCRDGCRPGVRVQVVCTPLPSEMICGF